MPVLVPIAAGDDLLANVRAAEVGRLLDRRRRLPIVVLGTLMAGMPPLALAEGLLIQAPRTATSPLALLTSPTTTALTLTVTTAADLVDPGDGKLSLREALARANADVGGTTIRFAAAIEGQTIDLTGGELTISRKVAINGDHVDGGGRITIDAGRRSRVLAIVGSEGNARLSHLVITGGSSTDAAGGGILLGAGASLILADSAVTHNDTASPSGIGSDGGGIAADIGSNLVVERTSISNNCAGECNGYGGRGGGISAGNANIVINDSDISSNNSSGGAGISAGGGTISIDHSRITGNSLRACC